MLALYVLGQDKDYILPYQLLAYANFLTASRDASLEYLDILLRLDASAVLRYNFLMGVAYYRNGDYERSVLKLSQVKNVSYGLDVDRYLVLNYQKLGQVEKLLSSRQKVLGHRALRTSDFFHYFYEVFFWPYSRGEGYVMYAQNTHLAENYLVRCFQVLQGADQAVCEYGSIGLSLAKGQMQGLEVSLSSLVEKYPQGYLYQALGEYYLRVRDQEAAKYYLLKAVGMASSAEEGFTLRTLLQKVI